jgi:hypothetical protein
MGGWRNLHASGKQGGPACSVIRDVIAPLSLPHDDRNAVAARKQAMRRDQYSPLDQMTVV